MQKIDNHSYSQPNQCQSFKCSYNAPNYCRSHLQMLCSGCSLVFHLDCDIKTTNGKELCDVSIGILNDVTYKLSELGFKYGLDKYCVDYEDSVRRIVETVNDLQQRYEEFEINIMNEDGYIKECRKVVRDVLESQAYRDFNEYQGKLQTCGLILNNICDENILTAHSVRSEFYLDVQRRDHEFRENTLKPIAEKVMKNIDDLRDEFNQRNYDINSKINQTKELNQNSLFKTEEQIKNFIDRLKEDYDAQLNTIKRELNDQKKEYCDMNKIIIHQHNDFKKELSEINNKLRDLDKFQKYHEKKTNDSELSNKTQHDLINTRLSEIIKCIEELNSKQDKQEKFCQNEFTSILTCQSKINEEFEENRTNQTKKNQSLYQSLTQRIDEVSSNFNKQMFNNSSAVQNLTKDLANFKDQLLNSNKKNECLGRF